MLTIRPIPWGYDAELRGRIVDQATGPLRLGAAHALQFIAKIRADDDDGVAVLNYIEANGGLAIIGDQSQDADRGKYKVLIKANDLKTNVPNVNVTLFAVVRMTLPNGARHAVYAGVLPVTASV